MERWNGGRRHFGEHMNKSRLICCVAVLGIVAIAGVHARQTHPDSAVDHAKRILDLLRGEKFEEVAKEFNAQVAAALSESQLRQAWSTIGQQAGAFTSFIDQRVTTPAAGITTVVLGCQFAKTAMTVTITFDGDEKIAGLFFAPRPA